MRPASALLVVFSLVGSGCTRTPQPLETAPPGQLQAYREGVQEEPSLFSRARMWISGERIASGPTPVGHAPRPFVAQRR